MSAHSQPSFTQISRAVWGSLIAAGALCSAQVQAQTAASASERPWYVGLNQDFTHVSNVLGATRGNEVSDTISTTTLLGGINTRLGRQRLFADAQLNTSKHREVDERDTDGYSLGLGVDWATIERLSGTVRIGAQQRQTEFGGSGVAQVSLSNVEKTQEFDATLRLGGEALLTYEAGIGWRKVDFSAPEFALGEYTQQSGRMGLVYRPSGLLTLRGGLQGTRTDYDVADARANDKGVYLGATWVPTGISTVTANLSYGRERATAVSEGFRGVTGSLAWAWRPTGRLATNVSLSRAKGREAGFLRTSDSPTPDPATPTTPTAPTTISANNFSQVTNRLVLSAGYELTGKISLSASIDASQRNYGSVATTGGKDRETGASLGARWAALRTVTVGCDIGYSDRNNTSAANTDAKNERFGCNVGVRLD
jgi:hypothetical protein